MGRRGGGARAARDAGALPEAIAALSRALPAAPSPETFRRAKFDLPEAVPALRQLLLHLLSTLPEDGASEDPDDQAARLLKSALCAQGYPRGALLSESSAGGSRELLLAFGWLLARSPLLEQQLVRARVRLGDEVTACQCEFLARPGPLVRGVDTDSPVDVRILQWQMGKLQIRWRNLASSQQEHCALLGQIHMYTQGCHTDKMLSHLSVAEAEVLRDLEGGQQLLRRLQRENERLEAALQWRRCESLFWQWMDSVLGACPPEEASQPLTSPRPSGRMSRELELLSQELWALQEGLQGLAAPLRAAWEARTGTQGMEQGAWKQVVQSAVDWELAALRHTWEQDRDLLQYYGPCRLVLTQPGVPVGPGLRVVELMGTLRSQEACLEEALHQLQYHCRRELARLVGALPGLIWVLPPPVRGPGLHLEQLTLSLDGQRRPLRLSCKQILTWEDEQSWKADLAAC